MAGSFLNPRLAALPCERMRGASFAENFISKTTLSENRGTDTGTGNAVDHGLTTDGNGYIDFEVQSQPGDFSVTLRFSAAAVSTGILLGNANLISGAASDGFCVWVDSTGVRANHSDGVSIPTRCSVDVSYADGETHTVTYVVDESSGKHRLFVDALAQDEQNTTIATAIGTASSVVAAGDGTNNFVGTLYSPRIFDALLSETEHDLYHADNVTGWFNTPLASYRCDAILDDTAGNKIWNRTTAERHLHKADRVTSSKFPTFDTDKYFFDLVDDYISNIPTLPTDFTITAAKSTPQEAYPVIQQDNDTSFIDLLSNEGDFWGYLHSLVIHGAILTALQLLHDEYQHFYWLARGRASGQYARLIAEETCKLAMFLDSDYNNFVDYSRAYNPGTGYDVTLNGSAGATFPNTLSHVLVAQNSVLSVRQGTVAVLCNVTSTFASEEYFIQNGSNYYLSQNGDVASFKGSTFNVGHNYQHIAVTFRDGYKPRFYIDGEYVGEGSSNWTYVSSTADVIIGNRAGLTKNFTQPYRQLYLGDAALTDEEIRALYESAQAIGATPMEVGNRITNRQSFAGTAVDVDFTPAGHFQIIDVAVTLSAGATTSENLTIAVYTADGDTIVEHEEDLSLASDTSYVFRFDKRHLSGREIRIDYANTDAATIVVNTTYQIDQSVV